MSDRVQAPTLAGPDRSGRPSWQRVLVAMAVVAVALTAVRGLLVQSFVVPTGSMAPAVQAGERVVVWRPVHFTGSVHRGDVLVFDGRGVFDPPAPSPRTGLAAIGVALAAALGTPVGSSDYVKRVVALPGERVACCDRDGRITIDGVALDEPYLSAGESPSETPFDATVPEGHLWMMGDHRSASADSRAHLGDPGGGAVPVEHVVGRVVLVWWPLPQSRWIDR